MEKLLIDGKFKDDFIEWLKKASLNYNTSFDIILTYGAHEQIDFLMKFLHKKPYGQSYKPNEHKIYDTYKMNEIIQDYNESFKINEDVLFHFKFNYNNLGVFYNQYDVNFEVREPENKDGYDVYYEDVFIKKIYIIEDLKAVFKK